MITFCRLWYGSGELVNLTDIKLKLDQLSAVHFYSSSAEKKQKTKQSYTFTSWSYKRVNSQEYSAPEQCEWRRVMDLNPRISDGVRVHLHQILNNAAKDFFIFRIDFWRWLPALALALYANAMLMMLQKSLSFLTVRNNLWSCFPRERENSLMTIR